MPWIRSQTWCDECQVWVEGPMLSVVELRRAGHSHDQQPPRVPTGPGNAAYRRARRRLDEMVNEENLKPSGHGDQG